MKGLNGHSILASALATSGALLSFGFTNKSVSVQLASIICATVIFAAAVVHDALVVFSRDKTVRKAVSDITGTGSDV